MVEKSEVIRQLRAEIMALERFPAPKMGQRPSLDLGGIESSLLGNAFPIGTVHEFISQGAAGAASTNGFIAGLLGNLVQKGRFCLWVSHQRTVFPPALKGFGVEPDRVIFIDVRRQKDVLWAVEQGLKCSVLGAVVGELQEITFAESQRLQLAVEKSRVTGFMHRYQPRVESALAFATRWKIKPIPSQLEGGMPGVGFPRYKVELVKVRNGRPGVCQLEWRNGSFCPVPMQKDFKGRERQQHYA